MVSKAKELVKGIVKKPAPKSTFGTDPNDPWSTKAGIAENVTSRRADLLKKFYRAKGYNINYVSKNQRVGQSKTGEFEKWKYDHGMYEEDGIGEETAPISVKQIRSNTADSPTQKRMHQLNKAAQMGTIQTVNSPAVKEEVATFENPKKTIGRIDMTEISDKTAKDYVKGAMRDTISGKKDRNAGMSKALSKLARTDKPIMQNPKLKTEDNINDPQSATQSPFDGANTTDDVAPKKSKASKMVKEIYAKHRLKEDLYDHEKDDKGPGSYGTPPKVAKKVEVNDDNEKGINARMVLKGGTTMTGEKRDTIEIDPMLKNRSKTPDYMSMDPKKQQLRTK
jgi:hypothetical protein